MNGEQSRILLVLCASSLLVGTDHSDVQYYKNTWMAHVPLGEVAARHLANSINMEYIKPDDHNDGYYSFIKNDVPPKSSIHSEHITNQLNDHHLVTYAYQEAVKARSYRSLIESRHVVPRNATSERSYLRQPSFSKLRRSESIYNGLFNDKYWDKMWYLHDYSNNGLQSFMGLNVVPVFLKLNITGQNVNVTVPDDGLDWKHPEIISSFNPDISWNVISNNSNIQPDMNENKKIRSHGTKCAGEIVMQPNNTLCGVGVAYGAKIGGIKFLDSTSTDVREATVLKYALDHVSIYSNSWGPKDDGMYMEHISEMVKNSLLKGISQGRDGKGAIYVFAAGNGKADGDNCACDGYVNSIYSIVVASCDNHGHVTYYSERCAAVLTTSYSGSGFDKNVYTTDVQGKCTNKHTGTSAAAPLVSGIIALGLSANPNLTWRDVQHLIVWTSQVAPLSDNYGWNKNAKGFYYSTDFGFGLINAYYFVREAMIWENVPEMSSCGIRLKNVMGHKVSRTEAARVIVHSNGCKGLSGEINFLEYVQLVITMSYTKRGDIQIAMKSPSGTECHVLESRPNDIKNKFLNRWTFTILAFWGESPHGNFVIDVFDKTGESTNHGVISEMTLSLHGTKDQPNVYKKGFRTYDEFELAKPGDNPRFIDWVSKEVTNPGTEKIQVEQFQYDYGMSSPVQHVEMMQDDRKTNTNANIFS